MSTNTDPLTTAELDQLDALNRARTPGPLRPGVVQRDRIFVPYADALEGPNGERVLLRMNEHFPAHVDDARAIAAALNALPALLAEVRASMAAAASYLIEALDAYGRAFCRAAHLDTQARRTALADAERAVLRCVEGVSK